MERESKLADEATRTKLHEKFREMFPDLAAHDAREGERGESVLPAGWMRDRAKLEELAVELESRGWQPDRNGDPDCVDQASAMAAELIRQVLLPTPAAQPQPTDAVCAAESELDALKAKIAEAPTGVVNRCALNSAPEYHITAPGSPLDGHRVALLDLDAKEG